MAGETFLEMMVAIVLLGTVVVGVLGGFMTVTTTSIFNRQVTQSSLLAQSYAEQLKQPTGADAYVACAHISDYPGYAGPIPAGWTVEIEKIEYLQGITDDINHNMGPFCPPPIGTSPPRDNGLQRIFIRAYNQAYNDRPNKADVVERVVIMKRDQRCSATSPGPGSC